MARNRRFARPVALVVLASSTLLAACSASDGTSGNGPDPVTGDEYEVVPDGKADNYYSDVASEFEVSGWIDVKFANPEDAEDATLRDGKINGRVTAVGLFLTTYVTKKLDRFFSNTQYGGFSAMARNHTLESGDITEVEPGHLRVKFSIDIAGPNELLQALPKLPDSAAGMFEFDLAMPAGYEVDPNNVPRGEIRNFDPAKYTGEMDHVRCGIVKEKAADDAWPRMAEMVQDGVLDVTLLYGHDYNTPRSDLQEAQEAFSELGYLGFTAPAASFEELKADSGPFVKTMKANGADVRVEVRIFHSDMFVTDRKLGHDTAVAEVVARDIFFYNGHAGPYYGFYLSDDKPNDVKYTEFATLPMTGKQQIIVAQGCQTYSQYADMFYENPAKDEGNLDVFTTVNFSYGQGTLPLLRNLLKSDSAQRLDPATFSKMVKDLNADYWNDAKEVFYGVIGIEENPDLHPFARVDGIGGACALSEDCGDPTGNACVKMPDAEAKQCVALALQNATCPEGTRLVPLAQGSTIKRYACAR